MTKFINLENLDKEVQEKKETVFTHWLNGGNGLQDITEDKINEFEKVVYLGNCIIKGDMFVAYREDVILIFKGIKGDEFE